MGEVKNHGPRGDSTPPLLEKISKIETVYMTTNPLTLAKDVFTLISNIKAKPEAILELCRSPFGVYVLQMQAQNELDIRIMKLLEPSGPQTSEAANQDMVARIAINANKEKGETAIELLSKLIEQTKKLI